jgi:hypothetical protein
VTRRDEYVPSAAIEHNLKAHEFLPDVVLYDLESRPRWKVSDDSL